MSARVKVTAYLELEDHEVDSNDRTGMTQEAYESAMEMLRGLVDVEFELEVE